MKKTLIAVACAAFISTGAMAKPASHQPPKPHNDHHGVQMVDKHAPKPANHLRHSASHHRPQPIVVAHVRPTPPPAHHHHHHNSFDFGDALIAFAILATAF